MLAAQATGASPDHPLSMLSVGEVPEPATAPGESVIALEAAALNHHDLWTLKGVGAIKPTYPRTMGSDGAGEFLIYPMLPCGDAARCYGCEVGDASLCRRSTMLGESRDGTLAQAVAVPTAHLLPRPPSLSAEEAAVLPSAYLTAWNMLQRASQVAEGDRVLVTGATGGLGVASIQLASAMGAQVVAQVRKPDAAAALIELGADVVVSTDDDVKKRVGEIDVVLENVGEATWGSSLRCLRPGGTVVVAGATSGANPPADLRRIFWRQLRVAGASMGSLSDFANLLAFVEEKAVKPKVAAVYELADARSAFEHLARGRVLGKIVLRTAS